jgi:hypothetical protein
MKIATTVRVIVILVLAGAGFMTVGCQEAGGLECSFDKAKLGSVPNGWKVAETASAGKPAKWAVIEGGSGIGNPQAIAITENTNTRHTYNLLISDGPILKDLEVEMMVKAMTGKEDQGGGPIWRAKDADNYYIARWNPLEDNFRVYFVKGGKRTQLASADIKADPKKWHEIEIKHIGNHIIAEFDKKKVLELDDDTFPDSGKVGLWTKADAATAFDDFEAEAETADGS